MQKNRNAAALQAWQVILGGICGLVLTIGLARFAYTPQFSVNGRDWRGSTLPPAPSGPASVRLKLQRQNEGQVLLQMQTLTGAPAQIRLWWAALEDGHQTEVRAGENRGVTLRHDHVVRDYASGPAQPALSIAFKASGSDGRPRRLLVVATDAAKGQVLQALQLGC